MTNFFIRLVLIVSSLSIYFSGYGQVSPRLEINNPGTIVVLNDSENCTAHVDLTAIGIGFCAGLKITNDAPYGSADQDASSEYPVGEYTVLFTATDDCNNEIVEELSFSVKDGGTPTALCIYGLSVTLSPMCELNFDASYIEFGSYDNCSSNSDLIFEIVKIDDSGNLYERGSSLSFGCDDIGNQNVALIVIDEAGNESYCSTVIQIQQGVCNPGTCDISDCIEMLIPVTFPKDINGFPYRLNELQVYANGEYMGEFTDQIGMCVDTGLASDWLIIEVEKEGDIKNGLDAMDLIILEGYLLKQWSLNAYAKIAADVNNDHRVSILDWFEIKQVILNQRTAFSANLPIWRFVDGDIEFDSNPWASEIPFYIEIENPKMWELSNYEHSLVGVKSGDIDSDASLLRSNETMTVNIDNAKLVKEEVINLSFKTNNDNLRAYQFTIDFDPTAIEFINIEGEVSSSDYNLDLLELGIITVVKLLKTNNEELFRINFKALRNTEMREVLEINSINTKAVAYNQENERLDVELHFQESDSAVILFQNSPNPFSGSTTITYNMEEAGIASIKILDITGKVVFEQTKPSKEGMNEIEIMKSDLGASGLYCYYLVVGDMESTMKMILF